MGATSKSRMLLLELLLSVFIFSACTVICTCLFLAGSKTASDSRELSEAVFAAQSIAESFKSGSGSIDLWASDTNDNYATIDIRSANGLDYAVITVISPQKGEIYRLEAARLTSGVKP